MPKDLSTRVFDYDRLDKLTSRFIREQAGQIRVLMKRTSQDIIEIGQLLLEVKKRLGHGLFGAWLKAEFNWDERTARRFMSVRLAFPSDKLSDLAIAPSALYVLAAPSTPDVVRKEALTRAHEGEVITHQVAQKLKQKYTRPTNRLQLKEQPEHHTIETEKEEGYSYSSSNLSSSPKLGQTASLLIEPRSSSNKPEILAVIPQKERQELSTSPARQQQLMGQRTWWQLGDRHLLYCGHPNSPEFHKRLPEEIALTLAFPTTREWRLDLPSPAKSSLALFSIYQDQDLAWLQALIKSALELYTEEQETVVFAFLPALELLILADKLGCRCWIAEPNLGRCEEAVSYWKSN